MLDLGIALAAPLVLMDATGGLGIAGRRGVGGVKHLATAALWMQDAIFRRELEVAKVSTERNVADAGTKSISGKLLSWFAGLLGLEGRSGKCGLRSNWAAAVSARGE